MPFQAPRGTQDVLPSKSHQWRWLEEEFLSLAHLYGYSEIRTPVFEDTEVFVRTSGETSDIVTKQMYTFMDKGDRSITLKPEGTAPIARAAIEHSLCPPGQVCRFSYVTPIYRYERPQKGRYREAHQVGLELIGSSTVAADAEIIELTVLFYRRLGLTDIKVLLNSLGREECRSRYREAILQHASNWLDSQPEDLQGRVRRNPLRLLDSKDPEVQTLMSKASSILDFLEPECAQRFEELQVMLRDAGVEFSVEPGIVRGLDYYTETVFEVQSTKLGAQSSLCGGGRYDGLFKELGGPQVPSVGVAMGIERALIVLEEEGLLPEAQTPSVFVVYTGADSRVEAFRVARELRAAGVHTVMDIEGKSLNSQMRQADKAGAKLALIIGDEEIQSGNVTVKHLAKGEQHRFIRGDLVSSVKNLTGERQA